MGTGPRSAVLIARPLTEVDHELSRLLLILVLIGGGGIVLAALLGTLVARTALAPIAALHQAHRDADAEASTCRSRLEVRGARRAGRLAESFNATLDALERSVAAQRHLIADASHELRTPISSLRANIQVLGEAERLPPGRAGEPARRHRGRAGRADGARRATWWSWREGRSRPRIDEVSLEEVVESAVQTARRRSDLRFELDLRADAGQRPGRPDRASRLEPDRQRAQVEPGRRSDRDRPGRRGPERARSRAGLR